MCVCVSMCVIKIAPFCTLHLWHVYAPDMDDQQKMGAPQHTAKMGMHPAPMAGGPSCLIRKAN